MKNKKAQVFHFDLYGKREDKYNFLNENSLQSIAWTTLNPQEPELFFVQKDFSLLNDYDTFIKIDELLNINGVGICSKRDETAIKFKKNELHEVLSDFENLSDLEIKTKYRTEKTESRDKKIAFAKKNISDFKIKEDFLQKINYRPFDTRWTYFTNRSKGFLAYPVYAIMKHLVENNFGIIVSKKSRQLSLGYMFITKTITDLHILDSAADSTYIFPLYLYPEPTLGAESERVPNFNMEIVKKIADNLGLTFTAEKFPSTGGVAESQGGTFPSVGRVSEGRGGRNTQNYMSLPYNPALKERAKELRKAGNLSEVLFWNQVKNKQFKGLDFDRQKIIGNYIVDFYCANCNVVVEIDGSSHDNKQDYDAERDEFLESLGLTVIHIPVVEVMNNMSSVIEMLLDHPALKGTPPHKENKPPRPTDTPPKEGNFSPIDLLDYIYAVLHSPTYREKYKEFLKIDFPRIPYPKDQETFWQLVELGKQIREIHLLESPVVENYITQYPIDGDNVVGKPHFENSPPVEWWLKAGVVGKVYINETQYFANVPQTAWEFYIGGYQPAQKWLKDRKDRTLDIDDILHYQKIIVALTETYRLMKEIDKIKII